MASSLLYGQQGSLLYGRQSPYMGGSLFNLACSLSYMANSLSYMAGSLPIWPAASLFGWQSPIWTAVSFILLAVCPIWLAVSHI